MEGEYVKRTIAHLHNVAKFQENPILKSFYLTKCSRLCYKNQLTLDKKFVDISARCPKCLIDRNQVNTSRRVKARPRDKFAKKLIGKENLTKFQKIYLKKHQNNRNNNIMVIECRICGHSAEKRMEKPVEVKPKPTPIVKSVKKKRKRDKFSGLNSDVVMSLKKLGTKGENEKTGIGGNGDLKANQVEHIAEVKPKMIVGNRGINTKSNRNMLSKMLSKKTKASKSLQAFLESV